jgi:hypothetical protein
VKLIFAKSVADFLFKYVLLNNVCILKFFLGVIMHCHASLLRRFFRRPVCTILMLNIIFLIPSAFI